MVDEAPPLLLPPHHNNTDSHREPGLSRRKSYRCSPGSPMNVGTGFLRCVVVERNRPDDGKRIQTPGPVCMSNSTYFPWG